ncbi:MAG: DUF4160 domain-containing protein [Bifidobacteriaceae bacterium]|nr:DUF4160 domain-containing protein [Bifidobacteriaceae bacterium]
MPQLARFHGITVIVQYHDTEQHHLPHVHAVAGGRRVSVGLDGVSLAGELSPREERLLRQWVGLHGEELEQAWQQAARYEPPSPIAPLP